VVSTALQRRTVFPTDTWGATAYVALSGAIGTFSFIFTLVGLCLGVPLLIVALIGLPIVWLVLAFDHVLGKVERNRAAALMGVDFPVRRFPSDGPLPRRLLDWVTSRGCWLELAYALVALPLLGWLGAFLTFCAWGGGLAFVTFPLWGWATAGSGSLFGADVGFPVNAVLHFAGGVALLFAAPWVTRGLAAVQLAMARLLLEPSDSEKLTARVDTLEQTRAGMVAAADAERRRIERDIHDGAQQHLAALAVNLGLARQLLGDGTQGPEDTEQLASVASLLEEMQADVRETIAQVRDLAHGIYPPLLRQAGLPEALHAAATRSPNAVTVQVDGVVARHEADVEAALYFCALEALQNIAKHAPDAAVTVRLGGDAGLLVLEVADDGPGYDAGRQSDGQGRQNMTDRVGAVGGAVRVETTPGAGTVVRAVVPVPVRAG
jgi:signal transduction histidine kinase